MARTAQARLVQRAEDDLAVLRHEGHTDSQAIRLALHEAADRRRGRSALRIEAQTTAVTPDRLGDSLGRLSAGELRGVDAALALVLGL